MGDPPMRPDPHGQDARLQKLHDDWNAELVEPLFQSPNAATKSQEQETRALSGSATGRTDLRDGRSVRLVAPDVRVFLGRRLGGLASAVSAKL